MPTETQIASVAAFNAEGKLLFGFHNRDRKWVLPGGHVEGDENPLKAAVRELLEETGLRPHGMESLGEGVVHKPEGDFRIHCYKANVSGDATGKNDPDGEFQHFKWVDVSDGLPQEIATNLGNEEDITLRLLGLQQGSVLKNEKLVKFELEVTSWLAGFPLGKMARPGPKFPKLGLPDDRRETPIVDSPGELKTKQHAMVNGAMVEAKASPPIKAANVDNNDPKVKAQVAAAWKENHYGVRDEYRNKLVSRVTDKPAAGAAASSGPMVSYAMGHQLLGEHYPYNPINSTNGPIGTQLHENAHLMLQRVQNKYGFQARQNLVQNLLNHIKLNDNRAHSAVRGFATYAHSIKPENPHYNEERLTELLNYVNEPVARRDFHTAMKHSPEETKEFGMRMKRAHRHLLEAGNQADETWLMSPAEKAKHDWTQIEAQAPSAVAKSELEKVSLTPESTANRMTPHTPQDRHAYQKVETYDNGNGTYHHVFYQKPMAGSSYQSVMHTLSNSAHPLDGAFASSSSGVEPASKETWPENSFTNKPWKDDLPVVTHGETASRGPRGSGTQLYQNMLKIHGRMASDSSTSVGANKVWEKIAKNPQFKAQLGYEKGQRHWAEYTGPKPVPMKVYEGDGRPIEDILKEPQNPYKAEVKQFKTSHGGDYLESQVSHARDGDVGFHGLHVDHANKKLYSTGPYWLNQGVPGGNHFSYNHSSAHGVAIKAAEDATGYTHAGEIPEEMAKPMTRAARAVAKAEPKPGLDSIVAKVQANKAKIQELAAQGPKTSQFPLKHGGHVIISPDPSKPGRWRATRLSPEGEPLGHHEAPDHPSALKVAHDVGADLHWVEPQSGPQS